MSVYITGDIHADLENDNRREIFKSFKEDDILIVLGDFGYSWNLATEKIWQSYNWPFTTVSVLGNHENYSRIYETYQKEEIFGDVAYKICDRTYYLKNGGMYTIDGKKFFAFGGALSIDKAYRTPYLSWWPEEIPSNSEYLDAEKALKDNRYEFDYFITHTGSEDEIDDMFLHIKDKFIDPTQKMVSQLVAEIQMEGGSFKEHFFGHMHAYTQRKGDRFTSTCLYAQVYNLNTGEISF